MDFTTFEGGLVSIEEADWTQFTAEVRGQVIGRATSGTTRSGRCGTR